MMDEIIKTYNYLNQHLLSAKSSFDINMLSPKSKSNQKVIIFDY